ncbi:MAG: disulfide bond formation protein B [Candidatus Pacebacteria bacterium]|nr:disulfide bond formation protein B [Candidatus Paceibacterota bacterium]MBP9780945.1 disulfide bond formation protein B [Candidatus Paceibacterota bacterium]
MIEFANKLFSIGGIVLLVLSLFVIVRLIQNKQKDGVLDFVRTYALHLGFVLSLTGVLASLYYSEIVGFVPCVLCWVQRIFIYPQVLLFGYALKKKDMGILPYSFLLTVVGSFFALYHNYIYFGGTPAIPCDANASCTQRFVFEFGFMTIPLMAFTLFLALGIVYFVSKRKTQ